MCVYVRIHVYTRTYSVCICTRAMCEYGIDFEYEHLRKKHSLCICTYVLSMVVTHTCVCTHNTCATSTCTCMSYCIATYPPIIHTCIIMHTCSSISLPLGLVETPCGLFWQYHMQGCRRQGDPEAAAHS